MRLSDLSEAYAPYHLINAALNIQGSDYTNRRGRNADFFLFSKYWIGSEATGYAPTKEFEPAARDLDLATAMAISGAAASSNMGAYSVRPLTPTLAILNIRLGYWLKNPAFRRAVRQSPARPRLREAAKLTLFLWSEITGRLYENTDEIYLTDGGHIENLGIYELLRRRCRFIVAVDAEHDATMHFPSLVQAQRYARIDLGIRITLPWEAIQEDHAGIDESAAAGKATPASAKPQPGPHVAIGTIDYGGGETGYLMYVKSSLTGDENDYIRDYARRNSYFPHETTRRSVLQRGTVRGLPSAWVSHDAGGLMRQRSHRSDRRAAGSRGEIRGFGQLVSTLACATRCPDDVRLIFDRINNPKVGGEISGGQINVRHKKISTLAGAWSPGVSNFKEVCFVIVANAHDGVATNRLVIRRGERYGGGPWVFRIPACKHRKTKHEMESRRPDTLAIGSALASTVDNW